MKHSRSLSYLLIIMIVAFSTMIGCGRADIAASGGDSTADDAGEDELVNENENVGDRIFPVDLAVASPFAKSSSAATGERISQSESGAFYDANLKDVINGRNFSDCNFRIRYFDANRNSPSCYGPQISYINHPDGYPKSGTLPTGDLGIWKEMEDGEACAAAKTDQLMSDVGRAADSALGIFAGMTCALNVLGLDLPERGKSLDLAEAFRSILVLNGIRDVNVVEARLSHSVDGRGSNDVFDFSFKGSAVKYSNAHEIEIHLRHAPLDEANRTYRGKLSFAFRSRNPVQGETPICRFETDSFQEAGSILYHKRSEDSFIYRLQKAAFCDADIDPFDDKYDLDPSFVALRPGDLGWDNNFNHILFEKNPLNGTESIAYAWQAGGHDPNTRVLNATLTSDGNGARTGCAYFGYGPGAQDGDGLGTIDGFICNWAGPGSEKSMNSLVQRQCVKYDPANNVYVPMDDSDGERFLSRITYAPSNSCDYVHNKKGYFLYFTPSLNAENDHTTATDVANDLLPIDEMAFTMPAEPEEVY